MERDPARGIHERSVPILLPLDAERRRNAPRHIRINNQNDIRLLHDLPPPPKRNSNMTVMVERQVDCTESGLEDGDGGEVDEGCEG